MLQYAEKTGINHARCWAHGRRAFFDALNAEPAGAAEALEQIKAMYAVEEEIRDRKLVGDAKQLHRLTHSKPLVELFFEWVDRQLERQGFTPTNPFIQALNYVRERRVGLKSSSPIRMCRLTRTTWSGLCGWYRWVESLALLLDRLVRSTSASSRV